ncbi:ribulose-phosphate 3-epimerase [Candidatus Micrarchaeota archaeon]|nr:ribulose-phosphate 3-epimerase [Candidatus Micrarchaeota archaeon]
MNPKTQISPSLLSLPEDQVKEWVKKIDGKVDSFHIDVMDNQFVPNFTLERFAPPFVAQLKTKSQKHVHLMTEIPSKYYNTYFEAGASVIIFHEEAVKNPTLEVRAIQKFGIRAGVSIKPNTPASVLDDYLEQVDFVLVMTVEPGFGGQSFMSEQLDKVKELRAKRPGLDIGVDGGINPETAKLCLKAGANILIAGNAIFNAHDPMAALEKFNRLKKE